MFWGALAAVGAFGLYVAGKKAVDTSQKLVDGLSGIGKMVDQNQHLADNSLMVATELQLLRSIMQGAAPPQPAQYGGAEQDPSEGASQPKPPTPRPFPVAPMDMYEAVPEDTEIEETDDARMVAYERLEELRQQGIESDPEELQDGVVRQV